MGVVTTGTEVKVMINLGHLKVLRVGLFLTAFFFSFQLLIKAGYGKIKKIKENGFYLEKKRQL